MARAAPHLLAEEQLRVELNLTVLARARSVPEFARVAEPTVAPTPLERAVNCFSAETERLTLPYKKRPGILPTFAHGAVGISMRMDY
jgi:hypothetical protein